MRIGINISADLRERMKPLMAVTNISQICRDALKAYVETYERAQERARLDGMQEVADRIAKRMLPEVVDWGTLGLEDAKVWVQMAKPEDFERLVRRMEQLEGRQKSPWETIIPPVTGSNDFYTRQHEHEEWLSWVDKRDDSNFSIYLAAKSEYEGSYLQYILAVWQMVKDIVAMEAAVTEKKFEEARRKSTEDGFKERQAKAEVLAKLDGM
jgi:hypothetical protein